MFKKLPTLGLWVIVVAKTYVAFAFEPHARHAITTNGLPDDAAVREVLFLTVYVAVNWAVGDGFACRIGIECGGGHWLFGHR